MKLSNLLGLLASTTSVMAASLQQVTNFGNNPTSIQMYIYVPNQVAAKPAVIVAVSPEFSPLELGFTIG
jgi:precorrin isomerase